MMTIENRLLGSAKKNRRPAIPGPQIVRSWPIYRGPQWLGDVVIVDAPVTAEPITYDAITANGDQMGPFDTRVEAAIAIGASPVQQ
jgi:hypothetical protein